MVLVLTHSPDAQPVRPSPSCPKSELSSVCLKAQDDVEVEEQEMAIEPDRPLMVLVRSSAPLPQMAVPGMHVHLVERQRRRSGDRRYALEILASPVDRGRRVGLHT